jgi:hypothetical protein
VTLTGPEAPPRSLTFADHLEERWGDLGYGFTTPVGTPIDPRNRQAVHRRPRWHPYAEQHLDGA